jgi:hypothetical protein
MQVRARAHLRRARQPAALRHPPDGPEAASHHPRAACPLVPAWLQAQEWLPVQASLQVQALAIPQAVGLGVGEVARQRQPEVSRWASVWRPEQALAYRLAADLSVLVVVQSV